MRFIEEEMNLVYDYSLTSHTHSKLFIDSDISWLLELYIETYKK